MGVPATAGQPGPYTKEAGNLGYNEVNMSKDFKIKTQITRLFVDRIFSKKWRLDRPVG